MQTNIEKQSKYRKQMSGYVLRTNTPLRVSDYEPIKWFIGYAVDSDFGYSQEVSNFWYVSNKTNFSDKEKNHYGYFSRKE